MGVHGEAIMPTIPWMDAHYVLAQLVTIVFVIGVAGCAIVIPLAAWKFFSVLLEKDADKEEKFVQLE